MLSVTQRIKTVSQPSGGYVPKSIFRTFKYYDEETVLEVNQTLSVIQGLAVDYLTRFMISGDRIKAFDISIKGAKLLDEAYENDNEFVRIMNLLEGVNGLDEQSVINTCRIVCYDSAFRAGIKTYQSPDDIEWNNDIYRNIPILVNRALLFLKQVGPVLLDEFTFEGGYTKLVSKGDGDFLTHDMLIDLKVSKNEFSIKWSLQLLMYYILGVHSLYPHFQTVDKLCIFNPYSNQSCICEIKDISDKSKYIVSRDVLGYKMSADSNCWDLKNDKIFFDYSHWKEVDGSDDNAVRKFLTDNAVITDFRVKNYGDGIFDITIDDYWTFLKMSFDEFKFSLRPIFKITEYVKFMKKGKYFMFISVSPKGKYCLLHGARLHSLKYPLEYYYENLDKYAIAVVSHFKTYWDALRDVSKQIQSLNPSEKFYREKYSEYRAYEEANGTPKRLISSFKEWYSDNGYLYKCSGKVHGCIVDIDYSNHIYINPYDGTVTSYNAASMYDKNVYKNTRSLLSAQRPDLLPAFDALISANGSKTSTGLLVQNQDASNNYLVNQDDIISKDFIKEYDYSMYEMSNRLKPLQNIYDKKLIQIWYDEILGNAPALPEVKEKSMRFTWSKLMADFYIESDISIGQRGNYEAKLICYRSATDVDVEFSDGVVLANVKCRDWYNGNLWHPNDENRILSKEEYIGKSKVQKNGFTATIIRYGSYKDVDVQFEDGKIVEHILYSKWNTGCINHPDIPVENTKLGSGKKKYLGMTKRMNCGLRATIIEYIDSRNVTVQFEDGVIRKGVRTDHFMIGKVRHISN